MTRLPVVVFGVLVAATIGAFFVTQHLKITNPLIQGDPRADPPSINPISGHICRDLVGQAVSFKRTRLNFYLQSRSDTVGVYVVNEFGNIIDTVTSGRYMRLNDRSTFIWDGRQGNGHGPVAPDGVYYFRIALQQENRTFELTNDPVHVITTSPHPDVTRVVESAAPRSAGTAIIAPPQMVTIHFRRANYKTTRINLYRTDLGSRAPLVFSFGASGLSGRATWNGRIHGRPAPAGTYLVGMSVTDQACNPGSFPSVIPPSPGSTPHTGVTVRYLAVQPPLTPVPAGSPATVLVDSRLHPYTWALRRGSARKVLARGAARGGEYSLRVPIPALGAALYELAVRSDGHRTIVPLIASAAGRRAAARVLVVVPALSWQGSNPVDDDGGGLPDTLAAGDRIAVDRPLVDGLPADFPEELALLAYLDSHHMDYQLTSDVALAAAQGPALTGHTGVVLDGRFSWLPSSLGPTLRSFAAAGGHVLSLGVSSLQAAAPLQNTSSGPVAGPPSSLSTDPFGATHGSVTSTGQNLITVITDRLGIFGTTLAFPGFASYQLITPPNGVTTSLAGTADGTPTITGFRVGNGTVVEVGLPGFATSLAHNVDSQELVGRAWQLLSR